MKKLVLSCFAACLCVLASAQKVYFLYLQSDDQTPFYVKMGDKIHSSANSGYLILPNLVDGNYNFGLGFAKSSAPEAKFSVTISQNDKGYLIKNFTDGLALFDIQDLSLVKATATQPDNTVYETKTDRFSTVLSKAANDPGLLRVPVAKKEEPAKQNPAVTEVVMAKEIKETTTAKNEDTKPAEQPPVDTPATEPVTGTAIATAPNQEIAIDDTTAIRSVVKETKEQPTQPVQKAEKRDVVGTDAVAYKPSVINRYSESSTTEGFGVVYFDKKEDGVDTIRILIPSPRIRLVADTETAAGTELQVRDEIIDSSAETKTKELENAPKESTAPATIVSVSSCKSTASDKDFLKLRRKMASKDSNDAMLDEARKELRARCYSVEQIRNLSALFLTSASKYQFFDIAYYHVTDKSNFASLGEEIKDEHYSKRFKALIGE